MEQFRNKIDGFREIRNGMIKRSIPTFLISMCGGLLMSFFNSNGKQIDLNLFFLVIPIMLGSVVFGLYRGIKLQRKIYESYVLSVDNNSITREQHNTPKISILKTEIKEITKNTNGSFTIKGNSKVNLIGIPSQIDGYERLENLLSEIKPIANQGSKPFFQKFPFLLSILPIGLMAGVYISKERIIVGICGVVLLGLLGYSFFEIQRNKNIDKRTKKWSWAFILIAYSIVSIMYFKLTGKQ